MKKLKRTFVVLIALGMIVSLTMVIPASAQNSSQERVKVEDSEFVFATMNSSGEIAGIQLFDWLSLSGDGTVEVKEVQSIEGDTSWQGVRGFTKPTMEDGYIVWPEISVDGNSNVIANTKFSESMVEEAKMKIPLDVRFRYYFDGAPVKDNDLESITGKSGRFKMEVTFKNDSKELTEVEYEDLDTGEMVTEMVETYLPMVILPYDWYFDNTIFFNLEADPTGVVVWMPDFYNVGWSIPLFPPATGESHLISVAADVVDFQMPPLTLAVAFDFPETNQVNPLVFIRPAMEQIYDGLKTVNEGIGTPTTDPSLLFGITAVDDGLQQMAAGLPEAPSNLNSKLIPGVNQMVAGIGSPTTDGTLLYANTAVTGGLQGMSAGIGSATTPETLLFAIDAILTNLQAISAGLGSPTNPTSIIGGIYATLIGLGYDPATPGVLQGLQQISAGLGTASDPTTLIGGLSLIAANMDPTSPTSVYAAVAGVSALMKPGSGGVYDYVAGLAIPADPLWAAAYQPTILGTLAAYTPNLDAAAVGITTMYGYLTAPLPNGIIPNLQYIKGGVIDGMLIPGINQMLGGLPLLYAGLIGIQAGIGTTTTGDTLLYAAQAIEGGLNLTKAGIGDAAVPDTLLYATAAIQGGLYDIQQGLSSGDINNPAIKEGLIMISQGLSDAVAGLGSASTPDTLLYGSGAVKEGLTDVGDGTQQLEAGVGSFVDAFNLSDAQLEAIAMRGAEFDHLLGRAEKPAKNNVRLVYQMNPTYNYKSGSNTSWVVAIILSVLIALLLVAGGIMLARSKGTA